MLSICKGSFKLVLNSFKTQVLCGKRGQSMIRVLTPTRYYCVQQAPHIKFTKKKELGLGAWLLLLFPVASFGLGTWQVKRKKWKEGLIEDLMVKTRFPAIELPQDDGELGELEYRKVRVRGEFEHDKELYLGPRSCLIEGDSKVNQGTIISKSASGVSGYLVITPFILSDTKERILVNRGWVPYQQKLPARRRRGQIQGEVELEGVVRLTEPRPQFTPLNKPDANVWFSRDIDSMAAAVGSRKVFLDATVDTTVPGGPIGGQTRANYRNEHFSYILTWYSLSAATAVMWYTKFLR